MSLATQVTALANRVGGEVKNVWLSMARKGEIVRWNSTTRTWGTRNANTDFGVVACSTNDPTADPPPTTAPWKLGDIWRMHPDQPD